MRLYITEDVPDYCGGYTTVYKKNPNVDYVCNCSDPKCHGYGTRNQYGRDEICNECGKPLDWANSRKWSEL